MFERILVPLDGSALAECVIPHAIAIAKASTSQIFLLRILDPATSSKEVSFDPLDWQIRKAEAESYLKDILSKFEEFSLPAHVEVLEGKAAENIIDYANDNKVDLIVLSSHGESGISGWNVSSVVQKIILRARKSIMIIRAYQPPASTGELVQYERVLVPLDGSQRAEIVLPFATTLAKMSDGQILVVHVIEKPEMPRRTHQSKEDMELTEKVVERNRVIASEYLGELEERVDARVDTRILISDDASITLQEYAEQNGVDLVLLSAHGYSGKPKWPYGGTVVSFIAYGTTPLLVIQDLPSDRIEETRAEVVSKEQRGR